jgi:GTPases - Sulfate adenylate transferase subunit 1
LWQLTKMDLVNYDENFFNKIIAEYKELDKEF